jgi:5-(carboxyamino)imidazole ribonucleotide synthase
MSNPILPPARIGILGGGQLGRMLALNAREMGYTVSVLDPDPQCPCGPIADHMVVAPYNSIEGAQQLARLSDVVTYEFENIGANIAEHLQAESYLPQGYDLLYTTQNRLREKRAVQAAGVDVAPYRSVASMEELRAALAEFGYPAVLKTCEGGYDGKGQWVIRESSQVDSISEVMAQGTPLVLERFVPFSMELSVIAARNPSGQIKTFPVVENVHQNNILHLTIAPARVDRQIAEKAAAIGRRLAEQFSLVGLLAIELFLLKDGTLWVNELAPRPHNSGHHTQQSCLTSQFEQHIRAVCDLPLDTPAITRPTVMVNILGKHLDSVIEQLPSLDSRCKVHLYGKKITKPQRKMGHMNVTANSIEEALKIITATGIW